MARSYPSRRFPGGPYIEPQVTPALRGPKRTGPIGELVPGDDVEVARILARLGRKPRREPVVLNIKVTEDGAIADPVEVGTPFVIPIYEDYGLLVLYSVEISITSLSTSGDVVVQLRNIVQGNVDMLVTRLRIDVGDYFSKDSTVPYEMDWEQSVVEWGDLIAIDVDVAGTNVTGLGMQLMFK